MLCAYAPNSRIIHIEVLNAVRKPSIYMNSKLSDKYFHNISLLPKIFESVCVSIKNKCFHCLSVLLHGTLELLVYRLMAKMRQFKRT